MVKTGFGQDSHRFVGEERSDNLVLGGISIRGCPRLDGNSDADVVLHAITNAVSGVSGAPVLGAVADELCRQGITDSAAYLQKALETLGAYRVAHVSVSIEAARPKLAPHLDAMRRRIAELCGVGVSDVGITATTGEGLTAFGRGEGIQAFAVVTALREASS
jgi:2-C-methyl-D-erythritol 2,4-cyclodiphosphate synthase